MCAIATRCHSSNRPSDISKLLLLPPTVAIGYMTSDERCYCWAYRKVGVLIEHAVKVLLYAYSVPVDEDMTIQIIHPPCMWDDNCFVV
jgi:hypothetical protein